ncbi:NosD domain-containing protein [Ureibacillus sp. FSL K6-8385]|uniref:Copper-binding protein n=1 Tax=Ureibacillus terrenus TaxID=118246 RepID=A0A540V5F4_9BACL|nr:NosD domain-containing protein [Ureibacillus terrenus]MED3661815.1 NosD domain-containing protein [Ureibacillus terrenus]MED3763118.1 NosD domain-containing protein [Ureibacillus terrenus]TQE91373.1 copper-binding protein [Ureibacillus terrenus]
MRSIILHIAFFAALIGFVHEAEAGTDFQQLIDQAEEGDVIHLSKGTYEGNFIIPKGITLIGDGNAVFKPKNPKEPVITVNGANHVTIQGIKVQTPGTGMVIKDSNDIKLSNLIMNGVFSGIDVYRTNGIAVEKTTIAGNGENLGKKGNGISFYDSSGITAKNNDIAHVQDGIYLENAKDISVLKNKVENGRYGTHFMYSEDAEVRDNVYKKNVTGLMIMMTENVSLSRNDISYQDGFNGTGITLYEVKNIDIQNHTISGNRVAISVQKSDDTNISNNILQMNQTAVEAIRSGGSQVKKNYFVGNLVNVRSDMNGIQLKENYYDDYAGIDIDDDGIGDEPYVALQSFGQWMVRKPVYQYYVEAPSVVLLNQIDQQTNKTSKQLLVDENPVTKFETDRGIQWKLYWPQFILGFILTIACIVIWRRSVLT